MGRLSNQAKQDENLFKAAGEWWASVEGSKARQAGARPAIPPWHPNLTNAVFLSELFERFQPEPLAYLGTGCFKPEFPFWHADLPEVEVTARGTAYQPRLIRKAHEAYWRRALKTARRYFWHPDLAVAR